MPEGYTVVPESLRVMAEALNKASNEWHRMSVEVDGLTLANLSLGALGDGANYPAEYEGIKDEVADSLTTSGESLDATARTIAEVAKHYSQQDAEYYEQFGYLESEVD